MVFLSRRRRKATLPSTSLLHRMAQHNVSISLVTAFILAVLVPRNGFSVAPAQKGDAPFNKFVAQNVRDAAGVAFGEHNPGTQWLAAFSTLFGYSRVPDLSEICPDCCDQPLDSDPAQCLVHREKVALCLFQGVARDENAAPLSSAMAHLVLAQFYRVGSFIGASKLAHCPGRVDKSRYLRHLQGASRHAASHIQRGLNKAHDWTPVYDESQLERRDSRHSKLGAESENSFRRLEEQQRGAPVEDSVETVEEMARVARNIARVKYSGMAAHAMSQGEACRWYEKSVDLDRKVIAAKVDLDSHRSPPPSSLVMLAQCYIHGTDGFTKDEAKGVSLLRECVRDYHSTDSGASGDTAMDDVGDGLPISTFECMSLLGTLHLWGDHGVEQDVDAAERLLMPAAKAGQAFASYGLGMMWFLGFRNNTDRNFRVAVDYLDMASAQGYLLARSYAGGLYLSGAGHGPEVNEAGETVRVNTRVEVDLDRAAEHYRTLVLEGGPWGDPDATIEIARRFLRRRNVKAGASLNKEAETAALSFEMKAILGYEEAAVSAGYLWDQIDVHGSASDETAVEVSADARSARWWMSTAHHHPQSRAAVDSLLFAGDKMVERGEYENACNTYADGLRISSSSRGLAQAKALGMIGWHLLLGRDCSLKAREKLSQIGTLDISPSSSPSSQFSPYTQLSLAEQMFAAAADSEVEVKAMQIVWRGLSWVARVKEVFVRKVFLVFSISRD